MKRERLESACVLEERERERERNQSNRSTLAINYSSNQTRALVL